MRACSAATSTRSRCGVALPWQAVGDSLLDDALPGHLASGGRWHSRPVSTPRQGQQLRHEPVHPVHAGDSLRSARRALCAFAERRDDVPLRAQHGQRRSQLVRRVGGEPSLASQRRVDPGEQPVHRADERLQLVWCALVRQMVGGPRLHARAARRRARHWRQSPPHRPRHREQEQRQQHEPGQQLAERQAVDDLVAFIGLLARRDEPFATCRCR